VLIVRSARVVLPEGLVPASIHIADGAILRVRPPDPDDARHDLVDLGDLVISPGLVDTHVHVNEPGRTEWEGFETATRAAAAGGVTTIVDMPLNSIPATTTVEALDEKRHAANGRCVTDVAFWGGVVPGNAGELERLIDAGVRGFKCFLVPSGVDEFAAVAEGDLRVAMPILARLNVPLLVHAESPHRIRARGDERPESYSAYLATRPPEAEVDAIGLMIRLAEEFAVLTHIVHVAAVGAVDRLARAQASGVPITAETCPHYLTFSAEDIPAGATEYKCAPPIREAIHRDALWTGLRSGVLGLVATDHSPAPPALKTPGDFVHAWGGIASLELSLAATWTGAAARGFAVQDLARWMSAAPAALAGLSDRKGAIAPGRDADLVAWDPEGEFVVDSCNLQQRHKTTPYAGRRLRGIVRKTFLRGRLIWDRDKDGAQLAPGPPSGAAFAGPSGRLL
jgi:allantoinase